MLSQQEFYYLAASLVSLLIPFVNCSSADIKDQGGRSEQTKEVRYLMGSLLGITLVRADNRQTRQILDRAFEIVSQIEDKISNYKKSSEISRLNQDGLLFNPSRELIDFLEQSLKLRKLSLGLFDPSVRKIYRIYLNAELRQKELNPVVIEQAKTCIGKWPASFDLGMLAMTCPGLELDTGGIGKGYAVDKVIEFLQNSQIKDALVHFGHSSTYALGCASDAKPWKLQVRFGQDEPIGWIEISNMALSASDSLGYVIKIGNKSYGHIINPITAKPIEHKVQAVVALDKATKAEAFSKYVIIQSDINKAALFKSYEQKVWGERHWVFLKRDKESNTIPFESKSTHPQEDLDCHREQILHFNSN